MPQSTAVSPAFSRLIRGEFPLGTSRFAEASAEAAEITALRALAEELLEVESVDADRLRQILAQHVVAGAMPPAREPLVEASRT